MLRRLSMLGVLALVMFVVTSANMNSHVWAQEKDPIVLRAYSTFPKGHVVNLMYEPFLEELVKRSKGRIQIQWVGGPESIPPFEAIDPLSKGVIDLAFMPPSYYADRVPEAPAESLYLGPPSKVMRNNPGAEMFKQILRDKVNVELLGTMYMYSNFMMIGNKTFPGTDLTGIRVRTSGQHLPWIQAMGGTGVRMPAAERYIGLERGVVDLVIVPITDIRDERLYEVSKYLIYPGFQDPRVSVHMNLDTYKNLPDDVRQVLMETVLDYENKSDPVFRKLVQEAEAEVLQHAEPFKLAPADAERFLQLGYETSWQNIIKRSPEQAPKLKAAYEEAFGATPWKAAQ